MTENYIGLLWIALAILILMIPLLRKIHNRRQIKTVTSFKRGTKSERDLVLKLLKLGIPAESIFHDLSVAKGEGRSSQIDVVVVKEEGIFVFEVKEYAGWIYGDGHYSHWTKVMAYGKKKYRFYNPIKQNKGHIKALQYRVSQLRKIPFFSIIVFYGDCEFKEINYIPDGTFIIKPHRLSKVLKIISKNNAAAYYPDKEEILNILDHFVHNGASTDQQQQHIEDIKDLVGKHRILD